ncbi:MAG: 1-deoxy-D-xylulose-5-phosphate reductoisomerase, partial [Bacteroidales bacterium]|nr:1-deoxy-D-xylulose-5-phosphate reductoisomerase [Bacteroidales bacterium]
MNKRRIAILGSTGSIGTQTLDVVRRHRDKFEVEMISAGSNAELLAAQASEFDVNNVVICNEARYEGLCKALEDTPSKVWTGVDSLCSLVKSDEVDIVVG